MSWGRDFRILFSVLILRKKGDGGRTRLPPSPALCQPYLTYRVTVNLKALRIDSRIRNRMHRVNIWSPFSSGIHVPSPGGE